MLLRLDALPLRGGGAKGAPMLIRLVEFLVGGGGGLCPGGFIMVDCGCEGSCDSSIVGASSVDVRRSPIDVCLRTGGAGGTFVDDAIEAVSEESASASATLALSLRYDGVR